MFEASQKYEVEVSNYGVGKTKNEKAFVWVDFVQPGTTDTVTWRGWLTTAKAQKNTAKNLLTLGWNEDLKALSKGTDTGSLPVGQIIQIETDEETWTSKDGEDRSKVVVKWINQPGTNSFEGLAPEKVHTLNHSMKAAVSAVKQERKLPPQVPDIQPQATADVPF